MSSEIAPHPCGEEVEEQLQLVRGRTGAAGVIVELPGRTGAEGAVADGATDGRRGGGGGDGEEAAAGSGGGSGVVGKEAEEGGI